MSTTPTPKLSETLESLLTEHVRYTESLETALAAQTAENTRLRGALEKSQAMLIRFCDLVPPPTAKVFKATPELSAAADALEAIHLATAALGKEQGE